MESQQLATKVAQLESRVATLEDEGKIIKGEVKQVLTEIRTAVLARENPFDNDYAARATAPAVSVISTTEPVAKVELVMPHEEAAAEPVPAPPTAQKPATAPEPVMLRPEYAQQFPSPSAPEPAKPQWSLLTIAGLSAWAEDAMTRLGPLRLEILLDLCQAAGHLTQEAREALSRITELEVAEPDKKPTNNETAAILRELEALVADDDEHGTIRLQRWA